MIQAVSLFKRFNLARNSNLFLFLKLHYPEEFGSKMGLSARAYASKPNVIGTCLEPQFGTKYLQDCQIQMPEEELIHSNSLKKTRARVDAYVASTFHKFVSKK